MDKKNAILGFAALGVFLALLVALCIDLIPTLRDVLSHVDDEGAMVQDIQGYGSKGIFMICGMQMLQVFIPFVPSAPIPILAGLAYGIWKGALLCILAFMAGHTLIFFMARQLGSLIMPYYERFIMKYTPKLQRFAIPGNISHPQTLAFFLYLIPMVPNGMLPYLFAQTKITYFQYVVRMGAASIPMTLVYCLLGSRIAQGQYAVAIVIVGVILAGALILLLNKNKIMARLQKDDDAQLCAEPEEETAK